MQRPGWHHVPFIRFSLRSNLFHEKMSFFPCCLECRIARWNLRDVPVYSLYDLCAKFYPVNIDFVFLIIFRTSRGVWTCALFNLYSLNGNVFLVYRRALQVRMTPRQRHVSIKTESIERLTHSFAWLWNEPYPLTDLQNQTNKIRVTAYNCIDIK